MRFYYKDSVLLNRLITGMGNYGQYEYLMGYKKTSACVHQWKTKEEEDYYILIITINKDSIHNNLIFVLTFSIHQDDIYIYMNFGIAYRALY